MPPSINNNQKPIPESRSSCGPRPAAGRHVSNSQGHNTTTTTTALPTKEGQGKKSEQGLEQHVVKKMTTAPLNSKERQRQQQQRDKTTAWSEHSSNFDLMQVVHDRALEAQEDDYHDDVNLQSMPSNHRSEARQQLQQPGAFTGGPGRQLARVDNYNPSLLVAPSAYVPPPLCSPPPPQENSSSSSSSIDKEVEEVVAWHVDDNNSEKELPNAQPFEKGRQDVHKTRKLLDFLCFMCLLVLLMIIVGIILGIRLSSSSSNSSDADASGHVSTTSSVPSNMSSTTSSPTAAPTSIATLLLHDLPNATLTSLQDPFSSQSLAYHWLEQHPDICSMELWRMKQLFVLATFYYSFGGPTWPYGLNADWLNYDKSECDWFSDTFGRFVGDGSFVHDINSTSSSCNEEGEYVDLDIKGPHEQHVKFDVYNATMPPEIGLLTTLQRIRVSNHHIHDASLAEMLPSELVLLNRLTSLELGGNSLTGRIPNHLWSMTQLEVLDLGENWLSGTFPAAELGVMTNLQQLNLADAPLTGILPTELGLLTNLTRLDIWSMPLQTTIPTEIGLLSNLQWLHASSSTLSGPLPSELGRLTNVVTLSLSNNSFTGPLPSQLGGCLSLKYLYLCHNNNLTGALPSQLGQLPAMVKLSLRNTSITGTIPDEIGWLVSDESLREVDLRHANGLIGTIPPELCVLANESCTYGTWDTKTDKEEEEACMLAFDCTDKLCGCDCECSS